MSTPGPETDKAPSFPRWKKTMVTLATIVLVAGVGLELAPSPVASPADRDATVTTVANPGTKVEPDTLVNPSPTHRGLDDPEGSSLPDGLPPLPGQAEFTVSERISPFLIHGGISFFVAMAIGVAIRVMLKTFIVLAGIIFLGFLALSYGGTIESIDWSAIGNWITLRLEDVDRSTTGFREHILMSLPSAGMAGAGLATGIRRK